MRRVHVQRATTGEWLARDAQLDVQDPTRPLSKVGSATFVCEPDVGTQVAPDGEPMFEEWATIVTIEEDGDQITWRGIVTDVAYSGKTFTMTASTLATYVYGIPFLGTYRGAEVDPADVVRMLWDHVQSFADGDLGVVVTGSTGLKAGTYSTDDKESTAKAYKAASDAYTAAVAARRAAQAQETAARDVYSQKVAVVREKSAALTAARKTKDKAQIAAAQDALDTAEAARDAQQKVVDTKTKATDDASDFAEQKLAEKSTAYKAKVAASKAEKADGGAIQLNWWEAPDCGQEIDTLASDYRFDWTERHAWTDSTKSAVRSEVVILYPRLGRKRDDLYFEQGVNIIAELTPEADGDEFAQNVQGIGAGEGAGSVRSSTGVRDGRLRRVAVVTAKDAKNTKVLDRRIARELRTHLSPLKVTSVTVRDHPNTRIGSWQTGDDILLRGVLPHLGEVGLWHRITDWKRTSDTSAELTVERSDSYIYGG